jgi:MoxR-vWA-beta-propeller ternary system domain bpX2/FtsH ternary system domain X7
MSQPWAVVAPRASAEAIARLPRLSGLAICELDEELWLRGKLLDESLQRQLALIPGGRHFTLLADGQLIPLGKIVPRGRLPEGPWTLLADWLDGVLSLPPVIPWANSSEGIRQAIPLRLVRCDTERVSALLETPLAEFSAYVAIAPQWRIDRWSFAASSDGVALVRGAPLPSLPGVQWTADQCLFVPAGYRWEPAVEAELVRQSLGLEPGDAALLRPGGTWERIAADHWVRCTRSAVRLTMEAAQR